MPTIEASGRVEFAAAEGTGVAGTGATFNITIPASLTNAALVFVIDWWGNATINMSSIGSSAGTVVQIGTSLGATGGREGGYSGYVLAPSSGSQSVSPVWSASFGTGTAHLKTIAWWVLSGVDQTTPLGATPLAWAVRTGTSINHSITTTVDNCSLFLAAHDWNGVGNHLSTVSGFTRVANASAFSAAFSLEDAGAAGTESHNWVTADGSASLTSTLFAIAPAAGGGETVDVGLTSETDSAQSIDHRKELAAGLSSEADSAQSMVAARVVAIGLASEADSAQAIDHSLARAIGLASEADSAQAITAQRLADVGLASEADSALSIAGNKSAAAGLASEADSAQPIDITRILAIGLASETDTAQDVSATGPGAVEVGLASEADAALAITRRKELAAGLASESDTAQPMVAARLAAVGLASESDSAQLLTFRRELAIDLATETDSALGVTSEGGAAAPVGIRNTGGGAGGNMRAQIEAEEWQRRRRQEEEEIILAVLLEEVA